MKKTVESGTSDSGEANTASGAFEEAVGKHRLKSILVNEILHMVHNIMSTVQYEILHMVGHSIIWMCHLHHITASHEQRLVSRYHPVVKSKLEETLFMSKKEKWKVLESKIFWSKYYGRQNAN